MSTSAQESGGRRGTRHDAALLSLAVLMSTGLVFAMLYSLRSGTRSEIVGRLVVAALTAGAATTTGGLLGFLFGIPRTLQGDQGAEAQRGDGSIEEGRLAYRPNTSLEQISDWLTKILVGVGLTQIGTLQTQFAALGEGLGRAFGGQPVDEAFVMALVAMLVVAGFLFGFLWTRIYLPGAFRAADLDAVRGEVRQELGRQADVDAEALNLADQQLSSNPGQAPVSEEKLAAAFSRASSNARLLVFERARENRSKNWQNAATKAVMERSTPVFRALIKSGDQSAIAHRYHGQLGFALKDQTTPDYKAAAEALTTAIRIRGPAEDFGYVYYELNRAICTIMLDENFRQGKPSDPATRATILADLRTAYDLGLASLLQQEDVLVRWIALNKVSRADLARGR